MKISPRLVGPVTSTLVCLSLLTPACTVEKVVAGSPLEGTLSDEQERKVTSLVDVGFSDDHAKVCVLLEAHLSELEAANAARDQSQSAVELTGPTHYYEVYCSQHGPALSSWAACALPDNPVVTLASAECALEAEPYLRCLTESGLESLDSCDPYRPSEKCTYLDFATTSLVSASCHAELGGWYIANGPFMGWGSSTDVDVVFDEWANLDELLPAWEKDATELPPSQGYGIQYGDCDDDASYGFVCAPPDEACGLNCYCKQGEEEQKRIVMEAVSVDADFIQKVWDACGFPTLPLAKAN